MSIDVEDLEVDATPEDLMLSYVSGEKGKVRLHWCPALNAILQKGEGSPSVRLFRDL